MYYKAQTQPGRGGPTPFDQLQQPQKPAEPDFDFSRTFDALVYLDGKLTPNIIVARQGQKFEKYATPWELNHSVICSKVAKFQPVVDTDGTVVGHCGPVNGNNLICLPKFQDGPDLPSALKAGPIFVNEEKLDGATPNGWAKFSSFTNSIYAVLTSVDGEVLAGVKIDDKDALISIGLLDILIFLLKVADVVLDVLLVVGAAKIVIKAGTWSIKTLIRKAWRRLFLDGATEELAKDAGAKLGKLAPKIFIQEGTEAYVAVAKDGEILAFDRAEGMSHQVLIDRKLDGVLPKGAEAITIGKRGGKIDVVRSFNIHKNSLPASRASWEAALKKFE
jgi:hypothetical protein